MASSYSTDLKIELMVTGENAGTWGDKTNDNLNVIQQAIAGYGEQSIAGGAQTTALTIANSPTLSVARNIVIKLTGTISGNQIVTVPNGIEKTWIVSNGTTGAFTVEFKTVSGTGTTWSATDKAIKILYSDGTNINAVDITTLSGTVASAQIADFAVTSAKINSFAVTSAKVASFAVTSAKLASFAVTTAKLATNAVTAIKITQSTITQSKLAANSVGADQLISTGVTAASYTAASITVDADGRITAASSGSAGAKGYRLMGAEGGGESGTLTMPNATRLLVFMAGAGNAGPAHPSHAGSAGTPGAVAVFTVDSPSPIGTLTSLAYNVGNSGGSTSLGNFTTPAGAGALTPATGVILNGYTDSPTQQTSSNAALRSGFRTGYLAGQTFGGAAPCVCSRSPTPGQGGFLMVYMNGDL